MTSFSYSQKGKHGDQTISGSNIILNSYSPLNQNAQSGDIAINTNINNLINGFFTNPVEEGDLLLIIQIQGAFIDVNTYPTVGWGGNYTVPNIYFNASINCVLEYFFSNEYNAHRLSYTISFFRSS